MKAKQPLSAGELHYKKTLSAIGITMLVFLALINVVGVVVALLQTILQLVPISRVAAEVIYQLVYGAGYLSAFMLPVLVLKGILKRSPYSYLPMKTDLRLTPLLVPIIVGGISLIWSLSYINSWLVQIFQYSAFSESVLWGSSTEPIKDYQIVLTFIVLAVVPAFCEEFLFRGAILTNCLPFGRTNAILISATLFALMHQNAEQILYTFGAGILLGLIYERTGSIWPGTFLHLVNNFTSVVFSVFSDKLGGRHQELVWIILECLLCAVGMVCLVIVTIKWTPKKREMRDGVFEKSLPVDDSYATSPVTTKQAIRHFFNPAMIVFLVFCLLQILSLILMALLYANGLFAI